MKEQYRRHELLRGKKAMNKESSRYEKEVLYEHSDTEVIA